MKKMTRRERKIYKSGKADGYAAGYSQGMHDGNPFVLLGEALGRAVDKLTTDPDVVKALKEAQESDEQTDAVNYETE